MKLFEIIVFLKWRKFMKLIVKLFIFVVFVVSVFGVIVVIVVVDDNIIFFFGLLIDFFFGVMKVGFDVVVKEFGVKY